MGNLISIPFANLRPFKKKGNLSTSSGLQVNVCLNVTCTVLCFVVLNFISLKKISSVFSRRTFQIIIFQQLKSVKTIRREFLFIAFELFSFLYLFLGKQSL